MQKIRQSPMSRLWSGVAAAMLLVPGCGRKDSQASAGEPLQPPADAPKGREELLDQRGRQRAESGGEDAAGRERERKAGRLWAWGANWGGQFCDGTMEERHSPIIVGGLPDIAAVSAGHNMSLALDADGEVWVLGRRNVLASGPPVPPIRAQGLSDASAVAMGSVFAFGALKSDGTVWELTVLGTLAEAGTKDDFPVGAEKVEGVSDVIAFAVGGTHGLALLGDGTVQAKGVNSHGQLGDGTTERREDPVRVVMLGGVTAISAGEDHSLALDAEGAAWAWGGNSSGQLGDGTTEDRLQPARVQAVKDVSAVAAGTTHSLFLGKNGTVWQTGEPFGQWVEPKRWATPVRVEGLPRAVAVSAGKCHSLALTVDGAVWAWGDNSSGQLGDGTTETRYDPVRVKGLSQVIAISAGDGVSYAIEATTR